MKLILFAILIITPILSCSNAVSSFAKNAAETAYELERDYYKNRTDLSTKERLQKMDNAYTKRSSGSSGGFAAFIPLIIMILASMMFFKGRRHKKQLSLIKKEYKDNPEKLFIANDGAIVIENNSMFFYSIIEGERTIQLNNLTKVTKQQANVLGRDVIKIQLFLKGEDNIPWDQKSDKKVKAKNILSFPPSMIDRVHEAVSILNNSISRRKETEAKKAVKNETKECPYCAETIKKAAVVCRYCKKDIV